jgi:cytochrome c oxidase subunit 1
VPIANDSNGRGDEMTDAAAGPAPLTLDPGSDVRVDYLTVGYGWKSWLFTTDHKRIAILYLVVITIMFFVGGAFAVLIRLQLATPNDGLMEPDINNKMFTAHGKL